MILVQKEKFFVTLFSYLALISSSTYLYLYLYYIMQNLFHFYYKVIKLSATRRPGTNGHLTLIISPWLAFQKVNSMQKSAYKNRESSAIITLELIILSTHLSHEEGILILFSYSYSAAACHRSNLPGACGSWCSSWSTCCDQGTYTWLYSVKRKN